MMYHLIDKLSQQHILSRTEFAELMCCDDAEVAAYAARLACEVRQAHYGNAVFIRGLIEISNHCKNDCLYCGIRRSNLHASRYRLTPEQILECCDYGYGLGFRTFVLQGGEDGYFTDNVLVDLIKKIKQSHPDCAVTLSLGERSYESYQALREAGADRYLLRHETACAAHYAQLHPQSMSHAHRLACLRNLQALGYQTGTGFMVGSPFQTPETLADDFLFIADLQPAMVGIGPFIPHHETPFAHENGGTAEQTLFLLSLLRIMMPHVLLPATTALGTVDGKHGRQNGIMAGANVVMPNLSPADVRAKYMIYENKDTSSETAEYLGQLRQEMDEIGYEVVIDRGDVRMPF